MNIVYEYFKYKFKSKGRHGIHSPFVYDFVNICLNLQFKNSVFLIKLNQLKKKLAHDYSVISIEDRGAGSKKLSSIRSIRSIYKTASSKGVYARLLYQLSCHYKPTHILELGTSLGIGTIMLAKGNENSAVTSIDACLETQKKAKENIHFMGLKNIKLIHSTFDEFLNSFDGQQFDLVFVDGHHQGKFLEKYLELLEKCTHQDTIFILDDIRWNDDMFSSWKKIVASNKFHLTMDLFRMGIILKRPQQEKEHFVIKLKGILNGML
jgi:predicted O-methyltransferase YrrM